MTNQPVRLVAFANGNYVKNPKLEQAVPDAQALAALLQKNDYETFVFPDLDPNALEQAKRGVFDVLIVDTAGRLHVDENLMAEVKEIVADCHLSDLIIRELILKVHPKLVDHLVNQAGTPGCDKWHVKILSSNHGMYVIIAE